MKKRKRKQVRRLAQDSNVISIETARKRIQPPPDLTGEELRIFKEVVESRPPSHFKKSDTALLTAYCGAVYLSRLYAEHHGNEVARRMSLQTAKLEALLANRLQLNS